MTGSHSLPGTLSDLGRIVVGLDGEMSGTRPSRHRLIQIGVCFDIGDVFASRIGWQDMPYEEEALRAIGLTPEEARSGQPAPEVDDQLFDWLSERGVKERSLVAAGWRVSTFDIPFVIRALPRVASLLSHHTVELNALCYTFAGCVRYQGSHISAESWKKLANEAAESFLAKAHGLSPRWHDAGFDAEAAIAQWHWLREAAAGRPFPAGDFGPENLAT